MNERIKELAKQSQMVFWPTDHEVTELMADIDIEKFAELIIRECVQVCINEGKTYEVESAGFYSSNLYASAIKNHFGVEE